MPPPPPGAGASNGHARRPSRRNQAPLTGPTAAITGSPRTETITAIQARAVHNVEDRHQPTIPAGTCAGTRRVMLLSVTNSLDDPPLPARTVRGCHHLVAAAGHGADAAAGRHDGEPSGEDDIAARLRTAGLSSHGRATAPAIPTAGMSTAAKRCCTGCAARSCSAPPAVTSGPALETR